MFDLKAKYDSMPKAAKAAIWFTFCSFFLKGLGFITGPIFTRLLPPEEYGIVTLYVTYEQIILILATWEIQMGAFQRGLFKYENQWEQYARSTVLLVNILTVLFFVLVVIFYKPVSDFTRMSSLTLTLMFFYLLTNPAYMTFITRKRTKYDYTTVVCLTIASSLLNILVAIGAILILGRTAQVRFNAMLATMIAFYLYFYVTTVFKKGINFKWSEVKPQWLFMLSYEAPLVLHSLSYLVLGQADRVMIGKMVGDRQAAFYGVAYMLASAVTILQTSLNEALTPWRFQKLKEKDFGIVGKTTNMLLLILGAAILSAIIIAPEMMKLLFTKDYYEAVWSIPPVSISVFFMFLYSSFVAVESYYEKTKYIMYVSLICGLVNIGLNYLLIPVFGYIVCGYTTLLCYILFAILHYVCMKIVCGKVIPGVKIFSISSIVLISVTIVLCTVMITMLYPYWIARYSIIVIMLIIALLFRKKIVAVTSILKRK